MSIQQHPSSSTGAQEGGAEEAGGGQHLAQGVGGQEGRCGQEAQGCQDPRQARPEELGRVPAQEFADSHLPRHAGEQDPRARHH
eukprot:6857474-Lingulodinium_polyedra.AAC.1